MCGKTKKEIIRTGFLSEKGPFAWVALIPPFLCERNPQTHQSPKSNDLSEFFKHKQENNGLKPTLS